MKPASEPFLDKVQLFAQKCAPVGSTRFRRCAAWRGNDLSLGFERRSREYHVVDVGRRRGANRPALRRNADEPVEASKADVVRGPDTIARAWVAPLVTTAIALAPVPFLHERYRLFPERVVWGSIAVSLLLCAAVAVTRSRRTDRALLGASVALMLVLDTVAFFGLFGIVFAAGGAVEGGPLLLTAAACWLTNVATFALTFWYLNEALRSAFDPPRLLFPNAVDSMRYTILDYVYVAATCALAFGPTDTPPATTATRLAMLAEALISFVIVALVAARAVNAIQ